MGSPASVEIFPMKKPLHPLAHLALLFGIAAAIVLLAGCNTTSCEMERPDGTRVKVVNNRFLWSTEAYTVSFSTNTATLSANKAGTDSAAIQAAVQGSINGMAAAVTAGVIKP
jgi:hypothetical protein